MKTLEKNYKEHFLEIITRFKQEFTSDEQEKICKINYAETFGIIKDEEIINSILDFSLRSSNVEVIQSIMEEIPIDALKFGKTATEWVFGIPDMNFEFLGLSDPITETELRTVSLFSIYIIREGYILLTGDTTVKEKNKELVKMMLQ